MTCTAYYKMYAKNDGKKLILHWIKRNFFDVSQLANRLEDVKTSIKANVNGETRHAFLNANIDDAKRLILRASLNFLEEHDLKCLDEEMLKFCGDVFPHLIKSSPEILLSF